MRRKAGLNKAILDKAWIEWALALEWRGRNDGWLISPVPVACPKRQQSAQEAAIAVN